MSTLVCFHAHPDDESISTGGTAALAAQQGHRVVLVVATRGERGELVPGVLAPDEELWERRISETIDSAKVLGIERVEFLGYVDSGMMGTSENNFPYAFWQANVDQAADRLAAILGEEKADVLTVYDDFGGYGHPDHIQVHRVGMRAAEVARTPRVLQATMNQDAIRRSIQMVAQEFADSDDGPPDGVPSAEEIDTITFGKPEIELTHAIDVTGQLGLKRQSMQAHKSQIADDSWFLSLDEEKFALAFNTEWFIDPRSPRAGGAPFGSSIWD